MKYFKLEFLYAIIYILLFIIVFNLTIDNPSLELFRRYYWIIIATLSFIYPIVKLKKSSFKHVILKYLLLLVLTFLPEWIGDAVYYLFISNSNGTILYFIIFSKLSFLALTASFVIGILLKIIFIIFIKPRIGKV